MFKKLVVALDGTPQSNAALPSVFPEAARAATTCATCSTPSTSPPAAPASTTITGRRSGVRRVARLPGATASGESIPLGVGRCRHPVSIHQ